MESTQRAIAILGEGPFGRAKDLAADRDVLFDGLAEVALRPPVPYSALTDSLARSLTRATLERVTRGEQLDEAAQTRLRDLCAEQEALSARRYVTEPGMNFALLTLAPDDELTAWAREATLADLRGSAYTVEAHSPRPADITFVRRAEERVERLIGDLGTDTLRMSTVVMIIDGDVDSAYLMPTPQLIALNRERLTDEAYAADLIFHETLHQKFGECLLTRRLLPAGYSPDRGPFVEIPWNPTPAGPRTMDMLRVLSTAHVYTHLLTLWMRSFEEHGLDREREVIAKYLARATFFLSLGTKDIVVKNVGPEGPEFLNWLRSAVDELRRSIREAGIEANADVYAGQHTFRY
ncbi:hypothetical protein [Amycolatopsis xylanica]|uniref:hypothetical protein n=1 Tax=Amycolatopsis xylanica TaxID=589385 RepID=UPI00115FD657|nr:hypothetical protein [Amycolatopsis xylanica]